MQTVVLKYCFYCPVCLSCIISSIQPVWTINSHSMPLDVQQPNLAGFTIWGGMFRGPRGPRTLTLYPTSALYCITVLSCVFCLSLTVTNCIFVLSLMSQLKSTTHFQLQCFKRFFWLQMFRAKTRDSPGFQSAFCRIPKCSIFSEISSRSASLKCPTALACLVSFIIF